MLKRLSALAALTFAAFAAVGCGCPPARLNVTVQLDDAMRQRLQQLTDRNIEVDLVAVNAKEHERWEDYSMSSYWAPGDPVKGSIPTKVMIFNPKQVAAAAATNPAPAGQSAKAAAAMDNAYSQTLSAKDPIWDKWYANVGDKDIMRLYVLALLPGVISDQPGDKDPRRQILPLGSCRWPSKNVLIKVQTTGIITVTTPKPGKP